MMGVGFLRENLENNGDMGRENGLPMVLCRDMTGWDWDDMQIIVPPEWAYAGDRP